MRTLLFAGLITLTGAPLLASTAHANPLLTETVGARHGLTAGSIQNTVRATPPARLNPVLQTVLHPGNASATAGNLAALQMGRALRAFMVGNQPLGLTRQASGAYLTGVSRGQAAASALSPF